MQLRFGDNASMATRTIQLTKNWQFRQTDKVDEPWKDVKRGVPSTIHQDLMDNDRLQDPFLNFNEHKAQWVGEASWTYRTRILVPSRTGCSAVMLSFQGLDTFATVKLDSNIILETDNMFVIRDIDITDAVSRNQSLLVDSEHDLEIVFHPALLEGREIMKAHPNHKYVGFFNGEPSRLVVRKSQYHWGWDWGPTLMSCGVWRPVTLTVYEARIARVQIDTALTNTYDSVRLSIMLEVDSNEQLTDLAVETRIVEAETSLKISRFRVEPSYTGDESKIYRTTNTIRNPRLWYPHGYGSQALYNICFDLKLNGEVVHSVSKRVGIRKIELVQEKDSCKSKSSRSFYFRVNDIDVPCFGSNWIPGDSFLTNMTPSRYRSWLSLLQAGGQNMVRVWGGGIYEEDIFYDICDELGILVWQDFMFACGNYPTFRSFLKNVEIEATQNVRRLAHHPSLAIFTGNNEDYQVAEQLGLAYDPSDHNPLNWLKSDFPARMIYEKILPGIMQTELPSTPYHPSSPWSPDNKYTTDLSAGDLHQWNVWHGTQEPYQRFPELCGRFMSEFGMEAFPNIKTLQTCITDPAQLYPQSRAIDQHNKADGHERRIAIYLSENLRQGDGSLQQHIYLTQLVQAEAMTYAFKSFRRNWGNRGERGCGGALVWQLNDCWPVTSWSIIDYYQRKKMAWYTIKRCLQSIVIGVRREFWDWRGNVSIPDKLVWEAWVSNFSTKDVRAEAIIDFVRIDNGGFCDTEPLKTLRKTSTVSAGGTWDAVNDGFLKGEIPSDTEPCVIYARLYVDGQLIAKDYDWPQPLKYLSFPDRGLKIKVQADQIMIWANKPVKGLCFSERDGITLSDNCIDVMPGDKHIIYAERTQRMSGAALENLTWRYLQ